VQHAAGNQAAQQNAQTTSLSAPSKVESKRAISSPGDSVEQEADRTAERVMSTHEPTARESARPEARPLQAGDADRAATPSNVQAALRSPGKPLDPDTRAFMEPRFGYDFSGVRVHTGLSAEESARYVSAAAYTVGHNIVFGRGQYAPQTTSGRRLLAHELTHVVQQNSNEAGKGATGFALHRQKIDPRPLQPETITGPRHVRFSEWLVESVAGGGESRTEVYWADFEVDAKGVMRASVRTVSSDRAYRSKSLRLGDTFRAALQQFDASGVEVNAFEGDWSYMTKDEISENLKVFKEVVAKGGTREQAARETPSGKVAEKAGFEVTNVENVPESQEHLAAEGRPKVARQGRVSSYTT
jgi:hypothetical protein